ncbi:MAG: sigma factor-like helix-turn-helix DNA-binding protein, partial [Marinomonas sp.]
EDVQKMLRLNERVSSIDSSFGGENNDKSLVDVLADEHQQNPEAERQTGDVLQGIEHWLDELSEKQRDVITRRFGLRGHEASTLENVGIEIGLTRERVRQIQVEALRKLRSIMDKEGLSLDDVISLDN